MRARLSAAAFLFAIACDPTYQPQAGLWVVRDVAPVADTCGVGLQVEPPELLSIVRQRGRIRIRRGDGLFVDCDRLNTGIQRYACDELDIHVRVEDLDVVIREQAALYVTFSDFSEGRVILQTGLGCRSGPCEDPAVEEAFGAPVPCGVSWEGRLTFDYERPDPNGIH